MMTRRNLLLTAGLMAAGASLARADDTCNVSTKDTQAATTPDEAIRRLKAGNARVLANRVINCDLMAQMHDTKYSQAPFAAVLGCMDSRGAPELVFDQRIGSIFSVRIAGNFVSTDIIGSLEYAAEVAGAKLIVVLGHTDCGAVKGAVDDVKLGNLTATLANIRPAVLEVARAEGQPHHTSKDKLFVQKVADQNTKDAAQALVTHSSVLGLLIEEQKLKIVAAMYDVGTGAVSWFA